MTKFEREMWAEFVKSGGTRENYDAIFVGSGMGSLATAAILARHGKRVLVLEQHFTPGGFTHTFVRKGFEWDVGLHYVGEAHLPETVTAKAFNYVTGGGVEWASMGEVYDRAIFPGYEFAFVSGLERLKTKLKEEFPREERAIDAYWALVAKLNRKAMPYFADKALPPSLSKLVGGLLRSSFLKLSDRTTLDVLRSLTQDPKLIAVLTTQWGDAGLPPSQSSFAIQAMIAQHYSEGAAYPSGGSASIVRAVVPMLRASGGRVVTRARVRSLLMSKNRAIGVVMDDGTELRAKRVISGTGIRNSFGLIPDAHPARTAVAADASHVRPSVGHLCLYVALKGTPSELGLPKENLWVFPSEDHDANVSRYLQDSEAPFPVLYYSFPASKDPAWETNHPGTSTIDLVTVGAYEWFADWKNTRAKSRGPAYEQVKKRFQERLEAHLLARFPQLVGKVAHFELSTPLSTEYYASYPHGEIYGLAHDPTRFRQRWLRAQTPVPGYFITGQDLVSCGIAGALSSGVITASAILKKDCMRAILRA